MNIFKILSSGDGNVKEPSIIAFLGYLLNPKADHGLNSEFLRLFISESCSKYETEFSFLINRNRESKLKDLSITSSFDVDVLLEQAFFEEKNKQKNKQIVDIVIVVYQKKIKKGEKQILGEKQLKAIFLIETKIRVSSHKKGQLKAQYERTKNILKSQIDPLPLVTTIFLTPCEKIFETEFKEFIDVDGGILAHHIYWDSDEPDERTITDMIINLLEKEVKGDIEAMPEYTKETLKSFQNFIRSGFRSILDEEKSGEGKGVMRMFFDEKDIFKRYSERHVDTLELIKYIFHAISIEFPQLVPRMPQDGIFRLSFAFARQVKGLVAIQIEPKERGLKIALPKENMPSNFDKNTWLGEENNRFFYSKVKSKEEFEFYRSIIFQNIKNQLINRS